MIKPIMTKRFFLHQPSEPATADDLAVAQDLVDTLEAHRTTCVGMAANMIGVRKRIIAIVDENGSILVMLNPTILDKGGPYPTEEGCLSLPGTRETTRYERITISWEDTSLRAHQRSFTGRVAQAIQHEVDHCDGVLI